MKYADAKMCFVLKEEPPVFVRLSLSIEACEFPTMYDCGFPILQGSLVGVSEAPQWTILNVHDIPTAVQKESGGIAEPRPNVKAQFRRTQHPWFPSVH